MDNGMDKHESLLGNIASKIEKRRCDLIDRHSNLKDKVTTMERFIPTLMAYNIWMRRSDDNYVDSSYCKVRELMKKFSLQSDPVDRLLIELRNKVTELHQETTQLHDKIIDADMKLEETSMELESLELANKEMEEKLVELQNEVQKHDVSSLPSIHSDDLICLKKIHQLAQEELKLKNCIKELESKENMYTEQMDRLLSCKEFKCNNRKMESIQELEKSSKKLYRSLENQKHNLQKRKFALNDKQKNCCTCKDSVRSCSCTKTSSFRTPRTQISAAILKQCPCLTTIPSSPTPKTGCSQSLKQLKQSFVPCDFDITCNECETFPACKEIYNYNRKYERKCPLELPNISCDCNAAIASCSIDKKYQSTALEIPHSELEAYDSNSDEEFCECYSCA